MHIEPSGSTCGARVSGVDLSQTLTGTQVADIRAAWLKHRVLAFVDQQINDDDLERFTIAMGGFGEDPFFRPIAGRKHIAAILREAEETSPLFAENWHTDWSFLPQPPSGTCLMGVDIPPVGGDTLFADQIAAFAALPDAKKDHYRALSAIHSARGGYAPDGMYGKNDTGRSMAIEPSEEAMATQSHPLVRRHPETGEEGLFGCGGYIIGFEGMDADESMAELVALLEWQTQEQFVYRHQWEPGMLVIWDNRSVLHRATGGYDGHRRELHRTTIAAFEPVAA